MFYVESNRTFKMLAQNFNLRKIETEHNFSGAESSIYVGSIVIIVLRLE